MKIASIFQDGAVLQRDKPIRVWGSAGTKREVIVRLGSHSVACLPDDALRWEVVLPPLPASTGLVLRVSDHLEEIVLNNIALGDVWLAGGQSNMEFPLRYDLEREQVYASCHEPDIRTYCCPKLSYSGQERDEDHTHEGVWRTATGDHLPYFSAVGLYFALAVKRAIPSVPLGIIDCTYGGTSASCWMDGAYLTGDLGLYLQLREETGKLNLEEELLVYKKRQAVRNSPEMKALFNRMMEEPQVKPGSFNPSAEELALFLKTKYAPFSPFSATTLYHTMLKPILPCSLRGFLWYQGEEDTNHPELYEALLTRLIQCWRDQWGEGLPFIFAQLPAFRNPGGWNNLDFVPIRKAQEMVSRRNPNVHMVCTMDQGMEYDIHPKHKRLIGERMAAHALRHEYGLDVQSGAPSPSGARKEMGRLVVAFDNGSGALLPISELPAARLWVNGEEQGFQAAVEKGSLMISNPRIDPSCRVTLQYAIQDYCRVSLFNSAGHPALPFEIVL